MKILGGLGCLLIVSTYMYASVEQDLQELHRSLVTLQNELVRKSQPEKEKPKVQEYNFSEVNVKTVIVIDNIVKEFSTKTPCEVSEWLNKLENSCKCCLIQKAPELNKGKKPSDILQECIRQNNCGTEVIDQLFNDEGIIEEHKEEAIKKLITALYDKAIIVKKIEPINIEFRGNGAFTEKSLLTFLTRAHKEKKLIHDDFGDISCLTAKNIMTEKGAQTVQLFLITSQCSGKPVEYIFKEIASGTAEIIGLERSFLVPDLVPYLYPNYVAGLPSFVLPIAYMFYHYNGKEHYVSLMQKAPGVVMTSLIQRYKTSILNNKEDQTLVTKIHFEVGRSMANFHRKFMDNFKDLAKPGIILNRTYIHGDAHQANIFYDETTNHVTFIDNERITAASPGDPFVDIQTFIFGTMATFFPADIIKNSKLFGIWVHALAGGYLWGYIKAYDPDLQNKVLDELIALFKNPEAYRYKHTYQYYQKYEGIFDNIFNFLRKIINEKKDEEIIN